KVMRYCDVQAIEEYLAEYYDRVAVIIMECLPGAVETSIEFKYSRTVYDLCKKYNILFILGKVRQAAGRTGRFFCYQNLGESPQLSRIIANHPRSPGGFYSCTYIVGTEIMSLIDTFENASTFGNTPFGCAATHTTLDLIDESGRISNRSSKLQSQNAVCTISYTDFNAVSYGPDMCLCIDKGNPAVTSRKIAALRKLKGILVTSSTNRVRMSPQLVLTDKEADREMGTPREAPEEAMEHDDVQEMLWSGSE
ncbi:PLP-dependent transferase, partial [Stipitochalara longipes BDJ]